MPLTNIQVEKAKPREKDWKLYDEKGLYLLIRVAGHKWWRFKYRFGGRADGMPGKAEKNLSLGVFPEVSLKRAREKRDEARRLLADGIDPGVQRKQEEHQDESHSFKPSKPSHANGSRSRAGARVTARVTRGDWSSTSFRGWVHSASAASSARRSKRFCTGSRSRATSRLLTACCN